MRSFSPFLDSCGKKRLRFAFWVLTAESEGCAPLSREHRVCSAAQGCTSEQGVARIYQEISSSFIPAASWVCLAYVTHESLSHAQCCCVLVMHYYSA